MQSEKEAVAEGVFFILLDITASLRNSSNAYRALSFARPRVRPRTVLQSFLQDIHHGATQGFKDYDAHERRRRFFLFLLGFIGDTPAVSACLDVLENSASACCHQCRIHRTSSSRNGSTATGTDVSGCTTSLR